MLAFRQPTSEGARSAATTTWGSVSPWIRRIGPTAAAVMLLVGAFILDCVSGNEVSSSLFYVVGIAVAAWFVGRRTGLLIACLSAVAWVAAVYFVGPSFSKARVFYWNLGVEFTIYLITAVTFDRIHRLLREERRLFEQLNLAKGALERETQAVGDLQREMLPPALPEVPGYEWRAYYAASSNAGGDYYDFFLLPDRRIGFLVADASGHGAQAAVLMAMLRVLLHTSSEALTPPGRVLARLGDQIARTVPLGRFATACYAVLEPSSGQVEFSLAGHPPPLILRGDDSATDELPLLGGPPLGLLPGSAFEAGATSIRPGDTLILYTDGLTESMSPAQELFGVDRLRAALQGAGSLPLDKLRDRILARLNAHTAGTALDDDLTLLMLRRTA